MKVYPFSIPKPKDASFIYQEDHVHSFYDKLHQHKEIQISWVVSGEGTLIIGDTVNDYQSNDLIVIGSYLPHVFKSDSSVSEPSKMYSLFFSEDSFGAHFFKLKELEKINHFFHASEKGFKVISHRKKITSYFEQIRKASKLEQFIGLFKILNTINLAEKVLLSSFTYPKNYTDLEGHRMQNVFEYSLNHFHEPISLNQIAAVAHLSPNGFCKYFKQRTNKTYVQFLNEIRIEHAVKLLQKNKDLTISEVATLSGFNNISNFNRQFKLLKNKTPLAFR